MRSFNGAFITLSFKLKTLFLIFHLIPETPTFALNNEEYKKTPESMFVCVKKRGYVVLLWYESRHVSEGFRLDMKSFRNGRRP